MKLFWDTNLFIYLWESGPQSEAAQSLANWAVANGHEVITSTLTLGEILVHPLRNRSAEQVQRYEDAFAGLELVSFTPAVARTFARLRATHASLRPPDAIQLASALTTRADVFLTNDNRLAAISLPAPLKVIALTDWRQAAE